MKKFFTIICAALISLSLFSASGNTANAAKPDKDCGCGVPLIQGADRNKLVADLISSQLFKDTKFQLKNDGYNWNGANTIEVTDFIYEGHIVAMVPFFDKSGSVMIAFFIDGKDVWITSVDGEHGDR